MNWISWKINWTRIFYSTLWIILIVWFVPIRRKLQNHWYKCRKWCDIWSMRPILPKLISHKSLNTSTITLTCNNYNMIIRIWYHIGWKDHQIIFVSLLCCSSHLLKMPSSIVRIRKLLKLSACFFRFRNPRYILKYSICSIRQSKSTKIPPAVSGWIL